MLDLQRIEKDEYQLREGEQYQDFLSLLLQYIGDPQPELRDNLIYPMFYMWIKEENGFIGGLTNLYPNSPLVPLNNINLMNKQLNIYAVVIIIFL